MRNLTIYRRIFYQADAYTKGTRQQVLGVQVHSTGANNPNLRRYVQPDDGRLGKNQYGNHHNQPGGDVCASAYIGKLFDGTVAVYQTLPWDYRTWLSDSGKNGNANRLGYLGFEICEDGLKDAGYFQKAVMGTSVLLTAHLCQAFQLRPETDVHDHQELHQLGLASNHGDITDWLKKFGYTMKDYREEVKKAMSEGVDVSYIDVDKEEVTILYFAVAANPGSYLNLRSAPSISAEAIGRIPRGAVVAVLEETDQKWWRVRYMGMTGYAMHTGNGEAWLKREQKTGEGDENILLPRNTLATIHKGLSALCGEIDKILNQ